jgi:GH35 family endo-1,4-beta-xylanase
MKDIKRVGFILLCLVAMASCAKKSQINLTDVLEPASVKSQDSIDKYPPLISYIDSGSGFQLGAGVSLTDYLNQGRMYQLVRNNFNAITLGYAMKHGAVVQSDGTLDLSNVEKLLTEAKNDGISVYGHTLVWNANQNAEYLNGLIAPLMVKTPPFQNSLDLSGLKDASLNGWGHSNSGAGISVVDGKGMAPNTKAVELVAGSDTSSPDNLELVTPAIPVNTGHDYTVVFYIKSDKPGEGNVSFEGLENNQPQIDWTGSGQVSESFSTGISWKKISFNVSGFTGSSFKLHLNLGYKPNVSYYTDVDYFYVYDNQSTPVTTNLIPNGDFENGSPLGGWGQGSRGVTDDGKGLNGQGHAYYVTNPSATNYWTVQSAYDFAKPLDEGQTYNADFWVKGTNDGTIRLEIQTTSDYSSDLVGQIYVTNDWQHVKLSVTTTRADRNRFIFSFGSFVGTVYLDNIEFSNASGSSGESIMVDKTPEEKESIISAAMENWIKGMVSNTPYVHAWDVVNEPMSDANPSEIKTGVGKSLSADEFYWQDYLGEDYAVKAFKWAREYSANKDELLFINDYNLEYNLDKCRGLIDYVKYIDSHGARVDGIGTQMHIDINADKEKITEMFKLLAATGKLIKISELDIGLGTGITSDNATPQQYEEQEEMYNYVIKEYFKLIPKNQQYGITLWSPLDSPEGSSWRPGQPIGLWTKDYIRKKAYVGVATGLHDSINK